MKKQNYSRKREAILQTLRATKTHPTAEWVYQQLKTAFPDLSMGTVYRNLSLFKQEGTIASVGIVNGQERFDADVSPHTHFVCLGCGAVQDSGPLPAQEEARVAQEYGVTVLTEQVLFYGYCSACEQKRREAEQLPQKKEA